MTQVEDEYIYEDKMLQPRVVKKVEGRMLVVKSSQGKRKASEKI